MSLSYQQAWSNLIRNWERNFVRYHIVVLMILSIPITLYIHWWNVGNVGLLQREPWRTLVFVPFLSYLLFFLAWVQKEQARGGENFQNAYSKLISLSQKAFFAFAIYFAINTIAQSPTVALLLISNLPPFGLLANVVVWSVVSGVLGTFGSASIFVLTIERKLTDTAKWCFHWLTMFVAFLLVAIAWGIWYATPLYFISLRFVEVVIAYLAMRFIRKKAAPAQLHQVMETICDEGVKVLALSASLGALSIGALNTMISSSALNMLQGSGIPLRQLYVAMLTAATDFIGVLFIVVLLVVTKLFRDVIGPKFESSVDSFSIWYFFLAVITFLDALSQTIGPLRMIMNYLWTHPG